MTKQLRVVVVDDSRTFRTQLALALDGCGCARVVAHAGDGEEGLRKVAEFSPDLVTLDVEMPVMNGLAALTRLRERHPSVKVVMVSSHTQAGAAMTIRALELGAHDFIAKPNGSDRATNAAQMQSELRRILDALAPMPEPLGASLADSPLSVKAGLRPEIVAMGSSTGGPAALLRILPRLPARFPVPVVIVQHMPALFTAALANSLAEKSAISVVEATDGMPLKPGNAYVAPGGRHMRVVSGGPGGRRLELTDDPPEHFCRPAVDYLFRSVAAIYGGAALGVILTGMGRDGTDGLRAMKRGGAKVIGEDEQSCVVYGMPRQAKAAGVVDVELPADRIADAIVAGLHGPLPRV